MVKSAFPALDTCQLVKLANNNILNNRGRFTIAGRTVSCERAANKIVSRFCEPASRKLIDLLPTFLTYVYR